MDEKGNIKKKIKSMIEWHVYNFNNNNSILNSINDVKNSTKLCKQPSSLALIDIFTHLPSFILYETISNHVTQHFRKFSGFLDFSKTLILIFKAVTKLYL